MHVNKYGETVSFIRMHGTVHVSISGVHVSAARDTKGESLPANMRHLCFPWRQPSSGDESRRPSLSLIQRLGRVPELRVLVTCVWMGFFSFAWGPKLDFSGLNWAWLYIIWPLLVQYGLLNSGDQIQNPLFNGAKIIQKMRYFFRFGRPQKVW